MKFLNIKLVLIILLGSVVAVAQTPDITELEYYFDTDPGFGNGTSVTVSPDTVTSTTFNLDISGLSDGIHYVFIRAKNEDGVWSHVNKMIINKVEILPVLAADDIVELEYFFDTDPGFGNGTQVSIVDGIITSTAFEIDVSGLTPGFHKVYYRAKNENDVWSLVTIQNLIKVFEPSITPPANIVATEYFFDNDPGFGNGTPVLVTADIITSTTFDIDISGLAPGFHKVYFRARNENDDWSLAYIQNIVKVFGLSAPPSTDIVAAEYFFDTDPGFGNGTPVTLTSEEITNTTFDIDISSLDAGFHKVYFRTKNENRVWSLAYIHNIVKVSFDPGIDSPDIVAMEYFIDTDPGFGNGTIVSVIPDDSIIDYTFGVDVSALTAGFYDLYVRVKDENENWSLINIIPFEVAEVELTAFLEAPFNGSTMDTDLNTLLPLNQPFNTSPWNYTGTESVVAIPNANIVDWVLLETRNAEEASIATESTRSSQYAGFLLNDGSIVGLDGISNLKFNAQTDTNNFVVIYHRNHLGVLSADELNYSGGIFDYNFTSDLGQAYGSGQKDLGSGFYGLIGGDANSDGIVNEVDLTDKWDLEVGKYGYYFGDMNMDTEVDNKDKNDFWYQNLGNSSTIPE